MKPIYAIFIATTLFLGGCAAGEWLGVIDQAEKDVAVAKAELNELRSYAASLEDGSPEQIRYLDYLARFESGLDKTVEKLPEAREVVLQSQDDIDAGINLAQLVSQTIGGPWGLLAASILGVGGHIYRSRRLSDRARTEGGVNVARAVELAKDENGVVNFRDPKTKTSLSANLGEEGKKAVDKAQGKTNTKG